MNSTFCFRKTFQAYILLTVTAMLFVASAAAADIKLLYFYDKGCRWCAVMDDILKDSSIKGILEQNTDILRIDIMGRERIAGLNMTGKELAERYKIKGTPTVIFQNTGKELLRIPGAVTKKDFKDLICSYVIRVTAEDCLLKGQYTVLGGK